MGNKGVTLIEVLVTSLLFAVVLTMIGRAMVLGFRAQSSLSHKIQVHREASNALDLLVRDAELARFSPRLYLFVSGAPQAVPDAPVSVTVANEFRINRMEEGPTLFDDPISVSVGYWRQPADQTLRRTLYDGAGAVMTGTPAAGKIVARDVGDFQVSLDPDPTTGTAVLTATLQISTIEEPVFTQISVELP